MIKKSLTWIFIVAMIVYTIISILLAISISHEESTAIKLSWSMIILFFLLFIDVLLIMTTGRLKAIKDIIDWENNG